MEYNFDFEERLNKVYENLQSYTQLKQLESNSLFTVPHQLLKIVESSLVVAIYSLSEQLLKNTLYKILEVDFNKETQTIKDKYILKQMPVEKFPITPKLDRIVKELKIANENFKLYLPEEVANYKDAYNNLLSARHEYAHANNHTENIDFDLAIKFIEYLNVQYKDIQNNNYVDCLKKFQKKLSKCVKLNKVEEFLNYVNINGEKINTLKTNIDYIYEMNTQKYDIDYLNDIYSPLEEVYNRLFEVNEENFKEEIIELREIMGNF